jgi:uncharacterized damage-inducible protein DinB
LEPAKSTPVTVTQVTKLADLTSVELDALIKDRAKRCERHVAGFARRVSELYLALFEMEGRYTKQQGARTDLKELPAQTWTDYVEASGVSPDAYRKWKSRMNESMKLLGGMVSSDSNGKGGKGGASRRQSNSTVAEAAKKLAEAKAKLGGSAEGGNEQAKAHIAQYEKEYADAVAKAGESDNKTDATEKPSAETKINKRLAAIVEIAEKYIRVMERAVQSNAVTLTDRQQRDIEKARESWRKVMQDARTLSWAVRVIEEQEEKAA